MPGNNLPPTIVFKADEVSRRGMNSPPPNASIRVPFDRDAVRGVLRPETEKRR